MGESFFGFNIAVRGLFTAQRNLNVVAHNLNNVNTPGFSRQQAIQTAATPYSTTDGTGMLGAGSDITSIMRVRDEYLDLKYWSENIIKGEYSAKSELLTEMEVRFNEPSDSGFTTVINDFFKSLQELSKDPGNEAVRSVVKQKGVTFTQYLNSTANQLEKLQEDVNYRVRTTVEEINSLANQIGQLNKQIYTAELGNNIANDLRDRRTLLVDNLSSLINIDASEVVVGKLPDGKPNKHFVITIGGKALVDHFSVSELSLEKRQQKLNGEDIDGLYDIGWADGNKLNIKGGELKGYLEVRDGNRGQNESPNYTGIPHYLSMMNQFARTFAMAINEGYIDQNTDGTIEPSEDGVGHADGFGKNGSTGIRFFTFFDDYGEAVDSASFINGEITIEGIVKKYENITAKNITVSGDIMDDFNNIATSDTDGEIGNIKVLNSILEMRHNPHMFSEGAPEDFMKAIISTLGIDSQQAIIYSKNQDAILHQVESSRHSISGVSIDEELANMVKFQHAYNAAARMIVTMGEIYETLINSVGI